MSEYQKDIQHFILTRFNLLLWNKDKEGGKVRSMKWLEHRFALFERYCFPSIKNQSCQNYEWIVLFDSLTPEEYKDRIVSYQKDCPNLIPVFVEPEMGRFFVDIFREEMVKRLCSKRVISTYLDNDDAMNVGFIEDLQQKIATISDDTFIYFDDGYQFYTDHKYMMQIHYPRNHFVSYVEKGDPTTVKGVFRHGTHYFIYTIEGAKIEHIQGQRMWCEVIHEKNVENDAYFLGAKMVKDQERMRNDFSVDEIVRYGARIYFFKFLPRYAKTFVRRIKHRLTLLQR